MTILNHSFQGPFDHNLPFDNDFGCVYALVNSQMNLVDVGQTESVNNRIPHHDRKPCWIRNGCPDRQLYVFINGNEQARLQLEGLIRDRYNPSCGIR